MFRVHHEMKNQQVPGWFLTFTYDEKHVPRIEGKLSLRFKDVQRYMKRLRKAKYYVKYIVVGEYGAETQRPHYHGLIWTNAPDKVLQDEWYFGRVHFGIMTMQSAMYTLKYIIQPKVRQSESEVREKTRAQFSKGLGLSYLSQSVYDYHTLNYDKPQMFSRINGSKVALPRYYKLKIFTRYQLGKQAGIVKWESIRKYRREMRALIRKGIPNTKAYIQALRVSHGDKILQTTKFNQTL